MTPTLLLFIILLINNFFCSFVGCTNSRLKDNIDVKSKQASGLVIKSLNAPGGGSKEKGSVTVWKAQNDSSSKNALSVNSVIDLTVNETPPIQQPESIHLHDDKECKHNDEGKRIVDSKSVDFKEFSSSCSTNNRTSDESMNEDVLYFSEQESKKIECKVREDAPLDVSLGQAEGEESNDSSILPTPEQLQSPSKVSGVKKQLVKDGDGKDNQSQSFGGVRKYIMDRVRPKKAK